MGERASAARTSRAAGGVLAGAALTALGVVMVVTATRDEGVAAAAPPTQSSIEAPATIPPSTTAAPTPTLEVGDTLPPGPPERPTGLIGGVFYDALTGAGVDAGVARCAADALIATTPEADLLAMGIAEVPRPPEVDDLLQQAGLDCGVTEAQLDAAAG